MDNFWLNAAFYQAYQALGNTGKNPAVGCVIVKKNKLVGVGYTSKNGRPHAEENALSMAGKNASGSTMYLTLEPCCLDSNFNSCANQIINAGINKVVIGMLDYNKLTYKKGINNLKKNRIEIKIANLDFDNFLVNYSHYCFNVLKRPMIALKLANSADSKITFSNGSSKWITSKLSRKHVHQIRSQFDAILIGSKTFLKDNPSLTVRIDGYKKPISRVILDTNLIIDDKSKLINTVKNNPLIIFTNKNLDNKKARFLISKGIKIFHIKKLADGYLCILSIIKKLYELNFQKVLVEGGAKTASSFLNKEFCDFMYIYRANSFVGSQGLHTFSKLNNKVSFFLHDELKLNDNKLEVWINKNLKKIFKKVI